MHDDMYTDSADFVNRRKSNYAIAIYLPPALDKICQQFREKYDPHVNLVPAHITLVFPFETNLTVDGLSDRIQTVTTNAAPFYVELTTIGDFYPVSPIIYWCIENPEPICDLYFRLYACLDFPIPHKQMIPHVTLAREISNHRVIAVKDNIASYLPQEDFDVTAIDLLTPLNNERWVSVRSFSLKK